MMMYLTAQSEYSKASVIHIVCFPLVNETSFQYVTQFVEYFEMVVGAALVIIVVVGAGRVVAAVVIVVLVGMIVVVVAVVPCWGSLS